MNKLTIRSLILVFAVYLGAVYGTAAQTTSVLVSGLDHPNKIVTAPDNSLIVAEAGNAAPNTGRISMIDQVTGTRRTLIDGLPSAVSYLGGPAGDPDGPTGILLRGQKLYVTIGVGNAVVPGPGPGLELPNPGVPASPIFDSILEITLPKGYPSIAAGYTMTAADQAALVATGSTTILNGSGRGMSVRLIANLPDYRPAARPGNPNNVKASHLYGVEIFQRNLYVVDAGHNLIHSVDIDSGIETVLTVFPDRPNPLFPTMGGPFIEAVPDSVHRFGNQLIVSLLTGFPFIPGMAEVRTVSLKDGTTAGLIPNLTSAIDVLKVGDDDSLAENSSFAATGNAYYTLEFSTNQLAGAPGRLRYYSDPSATPTNISTTLITPTSMARNDDNGNIFITNIAPGTVTKVTFP